MYDIDNNLSLVELTSTKICYTGVTKSGAAQYNRALFGNEWDSENKRDS